MVTKVKLPLYWIIFILIYSFAPLEGAIERLVPKIIRKIPHSCNAFTQGLTIEGNLIYESTGLYEQSSVRILDLQTGTMIKQTNLPPHFFGEGLAIDRNRIIQLTWRERCAIVYDKQGLQSVEKIPYEGEGWGLCKEENGIWMSNGTPNLTLRDPKTFKIKKTLTVKMNGKPIKNINDLECVGPFIYANIWKKESILRIDKKTGEVNGVIDASHLISDKEKKGMDQEYTLNGIAYNQETKTFILTGKCWPWLFEVSMVKN